MNATPVLVLLVFLAPSVAAPHAQSASARQAPTRTAATPVAGCRPTVPALKKIASDQWNASHDSDRVMQAVDSAIGPGAADTWTFVPGHDGLLFTIAFPARLYRFSLSEALRKREPLTSASAPSDVQVDVRPTQIDAPNIEKVILERNGAVVPALSNTLAPHVMITRLGAKEVINGGRLTYPCSAFFPGARVTVTGIPTVGGNIVQGFSDDELEAFTGREFPRPARAGGLVGLSTSRIYKLLGESATRTRDGAAFNTNTADRLFLTIKDGAVVAVSNEQVLLADLRPPTKNPNPLTIDAPLDTPRGAVVRCGDGQYVLRGEYDSCEGKSGVAERYSAPAVGSGPDVLVMCGRKVVSAEWNAMSEKQQATFCGSAWTPQQSSEMNCVRPSTIGTWDWNRMNAAQQSAVCVPEAPNPAEKPCPRPPTIGTYDWARMSDEAKLTACRASTGPRY